jgi:signal transduction histidine kinase
MFVRHAASDPTIKSVAVKERGVQALYGVPLFHDDSIIGVAVMGSCTAQEFAEDDMLLLRALAERASAAIGRARLVEQLEEEAHLRDRIMAIVGHDLRTPLNALMMGAGHLLERDDVPDVVTRIASRMLRSAERMRRIIDMILDFTRVRAGSVIPLQPTQVRLEDVSREVIDEIAMAGPNAKIKFDAEGDTTGTWDAERIRQVVANLVENALAHGGGDGAEIRVRGADDGVEIRVHNGGAAIPETTLQRIFEPFRKSSGSRGLGLGLFIAREVARAHGGDIAVTSTPYDGTTFSVKLPRAVPTSSPDPSALH